MKLTILCLLAALLTVGTLLYDKQTLSVYYSTMQEENEHGKHGIEKHPETDKLGSSNCRYTHFTLEFSEKQYFIVHHRLHHDGYTSRVDLPPEPCMLTIIA